MQEENLIKGKDLEIRLDNSSLVFQYGNLIEAFRMPLTLLGYNLKKYQTIPEEAEVLRKRDYQTTKELWGKISGFCKNHHLPINMLYGRKITLRT
ncbi:MAG: hypothetical protein KJ559_03630 [Nanoarchaeota archaeon]|nr:hypothetical protein [Nanoarchaeota archaeon]